MSPDEYEMLLIAAGLASNGRYGFKMKPDAWSEFITGHRFVANNYSIDLVQKKFDIDAYIDGTTPSRTNRQKFYTIRIGNKTGQSADKIEDQRGRDGRLLTVPPRLNGHGMKCQSFRVDVSALVWDYKVENEDNDDSVDDIDDDDSIEDNGSNKESKRNIKDDEDDACSPTTKKRKYSPAVVSPATEDKSHGMDKLYPNLSRALGGDNGFDPTDPSVRKAMRSLLSELNDLLSTTFQLDVTELSSNQKISYIRVPRTTSDRSFLNSKEWVDNAIQVSGSKHNGTFESAYRIANHICRFYRDSFVAACETQRVPICRPMTATEFQGMISAGGVNGVSEKELKKHLSAHLGKGF
jgi:hypothetical protein